MNHTFNTKRFGNLLVAAKAMRAAQNEYANYAAASRTKTLPADPEECAVVTATIQQEVNAIMTGVQLSTEAVDYFIQAGTKVGDLSDGYDTFNGLRQERNQLLVWLACMLDRHRLNADVWRCKIGQVETIVAEDFIMTDIVKDIVKQHENDGKEDMFLFGWIGENNAEFPAITRLLPMSMWDWCDFAETIERDQLPDDMGLPNEMPNKVPTR